MNPKIFFLLLLAGVPATLSGGATCSCVCKKSEGAPPGVKSLPPVPQSEFRRTDFRMTESRAIDAGGNPSLDCPAYDEWSCNGAKRYGCYKGYCWSNCKAMGGESIVEWCYTTKGYSQDFNYVECSNDDDCCRCWKCAGSCTV